MVSKWQISATQVAIVEKKYAENILQTTTAGATPTEGRRGQTKSLGGAVG